MDQPLLVGAFEVDITPQIGLPMDGYSARIGVNRGIHDPLLAQILVLDDSYLRVAIVALDVMAVSAVFTDKLRNSLATVLRTTLDAILICASHTHAAPAGLQDWNPNDPPRTFDPALMAFTEERLIDAAKNAVDRLAPARLAYSVGAIDGIGTDRNRPLPAPDPLVTTLRFQKPDGTPIAIAFHYACHPTVLGPQLEYSADFPGAARRRLKAAIPDAVCLYLNGAAGNISTRFTRRNQTFDEVDRLGSLLGERVIELLEHTEPCETTLEVKTITVDLPLRTFAPEITHNFQSSGNQRIDVTRAEGAAIEVKLAQTFKDRTIVPATLSVVQIGPWKLLTVPGEAFNELAADLRQRSPWALVLGYTNDYLGYFPTQQAINDETYEALSSPYDARALDMLRRGLSSD